MHKSRHVIYHQNKLRAYRLCKYSKYYKKIMHELKQSERLRFPRRIAIWKALVLQCGGRNKIT